MWRDRVPRAFGAIEVRRHPISRDREQLETLSKRSVSRALRPAGGLQRASLGQRLFDCLQALARGEPQAPQELPVLHEQQLEASRVTLGDHGFVPLAVPLQAPENAFFSMRTLTVLWCTFLATHRHSKCLELVTAALAEREIFRVHRDARVAVAAN